MLAERRSRSSEEPELACERKGKRMTQDYRKLDEALSTAIAQAGQNLTDEEDLDPGAHLELVARAYRAHGRLGEMLREAVASARAAGHSWEAIGRTLGMSRQAAQQRFGRAAGEEPERQAGRRYVPNLSAFNEMQVLNRLGEYGWYSVAYGPLYHLVERDGRQWEHRRILTWSNERARLENEGWERIGTGWFPWSYYRRALEQPAREGDLSDEELLVS